MEKIIDFKQYYEDWFSKQEKYYFFSGRSKRKYFNRHDGIKFIEEDGEIKYKIIPKSRLKNLTDNLLSVILDLNYTPNLIETNKDNIVVEYMNGKVLFSFKELYIHFDEIIYNMNELFNNNSKGVIGLHYHDLTPINFVKMDNKLYWIDFGSFEYSKVGFYDKPRKRFWYEFLCREKIINGNFRMALITSPLFVRNIRYYIEMMGDNMNFLKYEGEIK